jgi:tetratricopeptide (TPR) repeat protein
MSIPFTCECGKQFIVPDEAAGHRVKCAFCGAKVRIAAPDAPESAALVAGPEESPSAPEEESAADPAPRTPVPMRSMEQDSSKIRRIAILAVVGVAITLSAGAGYFALRSRQQASPGPAEPGGSEAKAQAPGKPGSASHHHAEGLRLLKEKQYDEAITEFTQATKLNPKFPGTWYSRGRAYAARGDLDQAVADYTGALQVDTGFVDAYTARGDIYAKRKMYDPALADFAAALKLHPKHHQTFLKRGQLYLGRKEYDQAIADFTAALEIKEEKWTYQQRGLAYRHKGDLAKSLGDYGHAIRLDPEYAGAYYHRGEVHRRMRAYDKAIEDFNQCLKRNENNEWAYLGRASAYALKKEAERAIADYTSAIRLNAKNPMPYHQRGLLHHARKEYDQALQDLSKAIELNPNRAIFYWHRSKAHAANKSAALAKADREKALQLDPKIEK